MILLDATQIKREGLFYKWQKAKIACYRMLLWVIRNINMIEEFSFYSVNCNMEVYIRQKVNEDNFYVLLSIDNLGRVPFSCRSMFP